MRKFRVFVLLLAFLLLCSACSDKEVTEPVRIETTAPTEPTPDPVGIYEESVQEFSAAAQLSMKADIEKQVYVDTQVFKETSSFEITYFDQGTFEARVVGDIKFGDVHEITVDETYYEDAVYSKINNYGYVTELSQEGFVNRYIPAVMLNPAYYDNITIESDGISFSDANAIEDWIQRDGYNLVEASGKAIFDSNQKCTGFKYHVVYDYGSVRHELDYNTSFIDDGLTMAEPSKYVRWMEIGVADAPIMLERAYGFLLSSNMKTVNGSQLVQSGVANASYVQYSDLYYHKDDEIHILDQGGIQVIDYSTNDVYSAVTSGLYCDGQFVYSVNGEEEERLDVTEQESEELYLNSVDTFYPAMITMDDFFVSFVQGGVVFDYTFSVDWSELFRQQAQYALFGEPQYLDLMASGYECLLAEGYLAIDQYSGLPTSNSITYSATHTIDGEKYPLAMQVNQVIDSVDRSAYTAITGEVLSNEGTVEEPTPLFYRVSGQNGEQMWLLGTIHLGDERTANLPNEIQDALSDSDALAVEFDLNDFSEQLMQDQELAETVLKEYLYLDGSMIQDHLQLEGLYEAAVQTMKMTGQLQGMILYTKPVIWSQMIEEFYLGQGYKLSSDDGVDLQLLHWAEEQGKTILNVESGVDQLKMLSSFSDDVQEAILASTLSIDPVSYNADQMELYDLWCEGDEEKLTAMLKTDTSYMSQEELAIYEEYTKAMETDRNVQMLEVAEGYLESGDTIFFAVGLAHLLTDDGLVHTLRDAGYTVELVSYS